MQKHVFMWIQNPILTSNPSPVDAKKRERENVNREREKNGSKHISFIIMGKRA
jgi:hypothetical protein